MAARDLTVRLIGDSSDLEKDLKRTRKQLEWTQRDLQRLKEQARKSDAGLRAFGRSGDIAGRSLRSIGHGAAYALGAGGFGGGMYALFDITKKSIAEFKESERVSRQTAAALKSTGGVAGVTAKSVGDLANALKRKVAIDDEAIQTSENLLLTFTNIRNVVGKNNDIFNQATKATLDMATSMGHGATPSVEKLHNATILIGKALNDPIAGMTALRRVGVQLTQQQLDQIKTLVRHGKGLQAQKVILHELNKEFGGSAAKQATAAKRLNVTLGDIAESLGRKMNPGLKSGAAWLNRFLTGMQTGRGEGGRFARAMRNIGDAIAPFVSAMAEVAGVLMKGLVPALSIAAKYLKIQAGIWWAIEKAVLSVYRAIADKVLWALQKMVAAIGGLAGVAKHLPIVGGAFKKVQGAAKDAADEINGIRKALDALPRSKTVKINVIANDGGILKGDNKPAGRGGPTAAVKTGGHWQRVAAQAARAAGIDPGIFQRQIQQESGFNPNAVSPAGARGIAQFMPGTARGLGVDPTNPTQSLKAAAKLMASYIKKYGSWKNALVAYNAGPGAVGGSLPAETQKYIAAILGGAQPGTFNKGTVKKVAGNDPRVEAGSLSSALSFIHKHYPGTNSFIEDKGGQNQHLHISDANHKQLREIARALVTMGYTVGEYGGKPIPGVGPITTLKHKHYGPTDHYSGGALDVNSDGELIKAFGIKVKKKDTRPSIFHAPSFKQSDFLAYVQTQLDHFDLMVGAGLMSAAKAKFKKRAALKGILPILKGDTRLQALGMLRDLPVPKPLSAAQKTWQTGRQQLALAFAAANVGRPLSGQIKHAAGIAGMPVDKTINNPWLQAALTHTDTIAAAGQISPDQANALKKGYLTNALPFAKGDDARQILAALKEIADNTLDAANNLRASTIDSAGFLGGLTGSQASNVTSVLNANGITTLPDGTAIAPLIGNASGAPELAKGDIGALMQEVRDGQKTLGDVWAQIQSDLGLIAGATQETADNTQQQIDLLQQQVDDANRRAAIAMNETSTLGKALLSFVNTGIGAQAGGRRGTPVAGSSGVRY